MILIKDRHPCTTGYEIAQSGTWGNMILIKDYVFGVICFCFELLLFDWLKRTSK